MIYDQAQENGERNYDNPEQRRVLKLVSAKSVNCIF